MYYTYVIYSLKVDMIYIGQTNNIEDRLKRHNGNRNKWTKGKGPWELIYLKKQETRSEAMKLEKYLKGLKNPVYIRTWIDKRTDNIASIIEVN